jgi:DNA-binding IscR family transcriptional regulator
VPSPAKLSLSAVVEAVEGPVRLVSCVPTGTQFRRKCLRTGICSIRRPVHKIHDQLVEFLGSVSVADLAFDDQYYEKKRPSESGRAAAR